MALLLVEVTGLDNELEEVGHRLGRGGEGRGGEGGEGGDTVVSVSMVICTCMILISFGC